MRRRVGVRLVALASVILAVGCGRKADEAAAVENVAPTQAIAPPAAPAKPTYAGPLRVSSRFKGAEQVRIDDKYAVLVFEDGRKMIAPLSSISPSDRAWLDDLAERNPFTGTSSMVTVKAETLVDVKRTIVVSSTEDGVETVQLCPPAKFRNQLGGTCMIYARVHWLDIAGFYVERARIYKIINGAPPNAPWENPNYVAGLTNIETGFATAVTTHPLPPGVHAFEWARAELRKGRALLAAFPREIWQALPPGFVAEHPWNGGSVGHQIVVNGFTWNAETGQGTFHIVNSWQELPEFDLTVEAAGGGVLVFERSISPIGETVARMMN